MSPDLDFRRISPRGGSQAWAFEELCCQLARREAAPEGSGFQRFRGEGGDGGVECLWSLPSGEEWGWQAKFVWDIKGALRQLGESVQRALEEHPALTRYFVCLPFDLSPSKGPGGGCSQVDRFDSFKSDCIERARSTGKELEIVLWTASEIRDRLLKSDPDGGRRRFWFDANLLDDAWLDAHLSQAFSMAGPRYTPELHQGHALDGFLAALGRTQRWRERWEGWRDRLVQATRDWHEALSREGREDAWNPPFAPQARKEAVEVASCLDALGRRLADEGPAPALGELVRECLVAAAACEDRLTEDLTRAHGPGAADSAHFRQVSAEFDVKFPAAHLDRARRLVEELTELEGWLGGPEPAAAREGLLLISGPAGIGKTHGVCDGAVQRREADLPSLLLFGSSFREGSPVWAQIRDRLGLGADWTFRALLDALDSMGEAANGRLVLFIDALNESRPPTMWMDELPVLIKEVQSRSSLALCVTVRDVYLERVVRSDLKIPRFQHPGFAGTEFDACRTFFAFYGLEPPVAPLLHPDFRNPLFLKLACKALQVQGRTRLPEGWTGLQHVLGALLDERDRELREEFPGVGNGAASKALIALATAMKDEDGLLWGRADEVVTATLPVSQRGRVELLRFLRESELVAVQPVAQGCPTLGCPEDLVVIAYDRLRNHLRAEGLVPREGLDEEAKRRIVEEASRDPGLAQALALLLPERLELELPDLVRDERSRRDLLAVWLETLPWRAPSSIGKSAEILLLEGLHSRATLASALDAALGLALRFGHPLDFFWLHSTLVSMTMAERDSFWCPYLHEAFNRQNPPSPVVRLTEDAWSEGADRVDETVRLAWVGVLCWFFAAADRRVRDHATKAAVKLTEGEPGLWLKLVGQFLEVDDDSVVERLLACAYGVLLRKPEPKALEALASLLVERFFGNPGGPRPNALMRDHARGICDLASLRRVLPTGLTTRDFHPPYASEWPLRAVSKADLERYRTEEALGGYPLLVSSCTWGDFARYTVEPALRGYEHEVSKEAAGRWVFRHVLDLGYTPARFAAYDWHIVRHYGGGRGRPKWADRIGKKYQLIALARLLARVKDHVRHRARWADDRVDPDDLQGERLRDIDPSLLLKSKPAGAPGAWWTGAAPDFAATRDLSLRDWVALDQDLPDSGRFLQPVVDPRESGRRWRLLSGAFQWRERDDADYARPRRQVWLMIEGYLIGQEDFSACWRRLRKTDLFGRWMPEGWDYGGPGFVAEYPWGAVFRELRESKPDIHEGMPFPLLPAVNTLNSRFENDAWQEDVIHLRVPSVDLVRWTGTRWNGAASFVDEIGREVFRDPSLLESGPGCLLIDEDVLPGLLRAQGLKLIWTVLAERMVISPPEGQDPGLRHWSRAHYLDGEKVRSTRGHFRFVGE